jgi:hypothetical protein
LIEEFLKCFTRSLSAQDSGKKGITKEYNGNISEIAKFLGKQGKYGESLSDIVRRVLDELEECKRSRGGKK